MSFTVFYAWQSDRDPDTCRFFIRGAAKAAIKKVASDATVKDASAFDHATQGGMVHIADTIKRKIRSCGVFLADLTFVGTYQTHGGKEKRSTNANVAIELGYAMRVKNPKQFVMRATRRYTLPTSRTSLLTVARDLAAAAEKRVEAGTVATACLNCPTPV